MDLVGKEWGGEFKNGNPTSGWLKPEPVSMSDDFSDPVYVPEPCNSKGLTLHNVQRGIEARKGAEEEGKK